MKNLEKLNFQNNFVALGKDFYQAKDPDPVCDPYLVSFNPSAAELIDLDPGVSVQPDFPDYFGGNRVLPGSQPLAMVYSGHQFGVYNPRLGDGRGLLLGEVLNERNEKWDIHLKGAGPTRFARGFDGRATLRSCIREYLAGEALHGLGIPTTRSLAILGIRELIYRERPEPAAILVRLADSHIRFGSFEYFHYTNQPDKIARLADYVLHNQFPDLEDESEKHRLLFRAVVQSTASLIACWQAFGFVHGVMNTDNMTLTGTTFDYGPFGFLEHFHPRFTFNHSDAHGRYAFGQQPEIAYWNLGKFGETLMGLLDAETLQKELEVFPDLYNRLSRDWMGKKLGLKILDSEFAQLTGDLFQLLQSEPVDYTNFFRHLAEFPEGDENSLRAAFRDRDSLQRWLRQYRRLIEREDSPFEERRAVMNRVNPKFILRNYLLHRAIEKGLKESDFSEVERLLVLLQNPFEDRPEVFDRYQIDPDFYAADTPDEFIARQLSCSA